MSVKVKDELPGAGLTALIIGHHGTIKDFLLQEGFEISKGIDEWDYDVVFLGGGPDVSPFLYGQRPIKETHFVMNRDFYEIQHIKCIPNWVPKIGICRGAQLLCVLNGGSLYQDVDGHRKSHPIIDEASGLAINEVSSTHHQMMDIAYCGDSAELIAWSKTSKVKKEDGASYKRSERLDWKDPEVVHFRHSNSLCVQFHPEYTMKGSECRRYFFDVMERAFGEYLTQSEGAA